MKKRKYILRSALLATVVAVSFVYARSLKKNSADVPGFEPVRNDALALRFAPLILAEPHDEPLELLYRMSRDASGTIHIAYFVVWDSEENNGDGWGPFLSRWLYTGGLSLQRILFGPGDVEVIVMELQPTVQARSPEFFLRSLEFETALEYDPADFGVQHHTVTATTWSRKSLVQSMEQEQLTRWTTVAQDSGKAAQESPQAGAGEDNAAVPLDLPLRFLVMSWNHMFQLVVNGTTSPETMTGESLPAPLPGRISSDSVPASYHEFRLSPAYFDQDRWDHYKMFKSTESLLARNRAHPLFAREGLSSR